jgi:hypothetical protein
MATKGKTGGPKEGKYVKKAADNVAKFATKKKAHGKAGWLKEKGIKWHFPANLLAQKSGPTDGSSLNLIACLREDCFVFFSSNAG